MYSVDNAQYHQQEGWCSLLNAQAFFVQYVNVVDLTFK